MKPIIKEKKTAKKKFNWSGFFRYFRTIWKNDACVECSIVPRKKNNHTGAKYWWVSIPVFLASLALAMTPLTVHASQETGSTKLANKTFGIDQVLYSAFYQDEANQTYIVKGGDIGGITFKDGQASLNGTLPAKPCFEDKVNYLGFHKATRQKDEVTTEAYKDFEFYFINDTSDDEVKKIIETMSAKTQKLDKSSALTDKDIKDVIYTELEERTVAGTSFIAFTKDKFFFQAMANNAIATQITGDFKHVSNSSLKEILTKGIKDPTTDVNKTLVSIMNNYNGFMDDVFETNRVSLTAGKSGISLAVNGGVVILLGFILFFLTRGKQNPFRYITCYETLNMAMWATFLPSLLALIFGFIFPGMELMFFLITFGFRVMWMAMRNLRPQTY